MQDSLYIYGKYKKCRVPYIKFRTNLDMPHMLL